MSDMTVITPAGATIAPYMHGEEIVRDLSVAIDPLRPGARPKTPQAPTSIGMAFQEETDDLPEKVTTEDLITGEAGYEVSIARIKTTTVAVVHSDEATILAVKVNAEFVQFMTKAA
jgi:hypothetical protein